MADKKFRIYSVIENLTDSGLCEGEAEKTEITPVGSISADGEEIKIEYSEDTEGGRVDSEIIIAPTLIKVIRRGAVVSEMHFAEGLSHRSLYGVPPYSFDTEVYTRRVRGSMTVCGGRVDIFYTMKIGGQNKSVRMRIECA